MLRVAPHQVARAVTTVAFSQRGAPSAARVLPTATALFPLYVNVALVGALIMAVLRNGSQQMGWPTYFQEIIIGLVIIVAVFLDRLRQGRQA